MIMQRVLLVSLASVLFTIITIDRAATQGVSQCSEIACWDGSVATGTPPDNCFCNSDPPPEEPENPTCAQDFGCPDASYVGVGDWPECVCRGAENPGEPGDGLGDPASFDPGPGGAEVCNQFFECPPQWRMAVGDGGVGCLCKEGGGP